jgi:hypothetical protein
MGVWYSSMVIPIILAPRPRPRPLVLARWLPVVGGICLAAAKKIHPRRPLLAGCHWNLPSRSQQKFRASLYASKLLVRWIKYCCTVVLST